MKTQPTLWENDAPSLPQWVGISQEEGSHLFLFTGDWSPRADLRVPSQTRGCHVRFRRCPDVLSKSGWDTWAHGQHGVCTWQAFPTHWLIREVTLGWKMNSRRVSKGGEGRGSSTPTSPNCRPQPEPPKRSGASCLHRSRVTALWGVSTSLTEGTGDKCSPSGQRTGTFLKASVSIPPQLLPNVFSRPFSGPFCSFQMVPLNPQSPPALTAWPLASPSPPHSPACPLAPRSRGGWGEESSPKVYLNLPRLWDTAP